MADHAKSSYPNISPICLYEKLWLKILFGNLLGEKYTVG
jgi:hypothetical protein